MIFLSASIPYKEREKKYIETADIIAIRDSVKALATVVIPKSRLIWGGHPAITPLIKFVMQNMNSDVNGKNHITLYQTSFFTKHFPPENEFFEHKVIVPEEDNRESSLFKMREKMFKDNKFKAGIFIGGMEGVEDEFKMFKEIHPRALLLPLASTGAAAKFIYDEMIESNYKLDERLSNDYAYMALFRDLLQEII